VKSRIGIVVAAATLLSVGALRANAGDETAFIGTGHAMGAPVTSATTHGSPASPHWTASIGNGHTSSDTAQRSEVSVNERTAEAPSAHWTSKIGTGHAVDSNTSVQDEAGRVTASLAPRELNSY
jgi:hypothetical protein